MGSLTFTSLSFLVAGAICAAGPVIIHLLNRRRYRIVHWAAMDFLGQAMKRRRKVVELRDLVLLILRTLAVLLLGAALAQPYLSSRGQQFDDHQPLHAILILDNSLSMAYETLEGSLLEQAKHRAHELVDQLPVGSQVTVLPACGTPELLNFDPLTVKDDAQEAIRKIDAVERSAKMVSTVALARRACEAAPQFAKRIFWITDQQAINWHDAGSSDLFRDLPAMQIVSVAPSEPENTWIADLRLQDGLADVQTPTVIVAEIAHRGRTRRDLQVVLTVGETVVGQQAVTIEPGAGRREVTFECTFDSLTNAPKRGQAVFVPIQVAITPDRLPADDMLARAVPVVAALPVVFVDQYGDGQEDVARGRLGETHAVRKLLAPRRGRGEATRQLVNVRYASAQSLTSDLLADARLIVVAGVREPGAMVGLLADYVRDGGQLLIAAGADFDPAAWNAAGWLDGEGILPLPLANDVIGGTPEDLGDKVQPFSLNVETLLHEATFRLAGLGDADLQALYAEPFFFKAVRVEESGGAAKEKESSAAEGAHVLARFDDRERSAFLVERKMGGGRVLFCASGLQSSWNTLPKTNAVLLFDRLMRDMIQQTLPERNPTPRDSFTLPLEGLEPNVAASLHRPGHLGEEALDVGYIGAQERGVILANLWRRGIYAVRGRSASNARSNSTAEEPAWVVSLAVSGLSEESDLTQASSRDLGEHTAGADIRWVAPGESMTLSGAATRGQNSWWWLVAAMVVVLVAEMLIVAKPAAASLNAS
jgi:aerotolerance regulator-like protein/VWA domain-containing protein